MKLSSCLSWSAPAANGNVVRPRHINEVKIPKALPIAYGYTKYGIEAQKAGA